MIGRLAAVAIVALLAGCDSIGTDEVNQTLGGRAARVSVPPPDQIHWIRLEGGTFPMGSNDGDSNEQPVHDVHVATFELAKTEVTVAQYRACVDARVCTEPTTCDWGTPNYGVTGRDDHPVNCVDWEQARTFSAWVGGRLPSEAEWEYAARSGGNDQTYPYPWGDEEATCARAVMSDGSGNGCGRGDTTWPVCSKRAGNSAQGICDLAGNVWEWVEDAYGDYDNAPTDGSARTGDAGADRVFRGGGWRSSARYLRAAYRDCDAPAGRSVLLGFRPARF